MEFLHRLSHEDERPQLEHHYEDSSTQTVKEEKKWHLFDRHHEHGDGRASDPAKVHPAAEQAIPPAEHVVDAPVQPPVTAEAEKENKKKFLNIFHKHDEERSDGSKANEQVDSSTQTDKEEKKSFIEEILKHDDDESAIYKVQPPAEPAAEPVGVPVATPDVAEHAKRENLFERLHKKHHPDSPDKEDPDDAAKIDVLSEHPAAIEPEKKDSNIFANIARHQSHDAPEVQNQKLKQEEAEDKASFFDHLTGKAERDEEERRRREAEEKRLEEEAEYKRKHPVSNFFDQISGKAAEEERQRKEEEEKRLKEEEERRKHPLTYGLGKLIEGDSPENEQPAHKPNFFEKISGKAAEDERKRKEEYYKKHPLAKLKDQFDEGLGGGNSGEANEDLLDKAIDEFQEHVLHQGPQDDENAFEQIKDEQLARIIRAKYKARTGREFPIRDRRAS